MASQETIAGGGGGAGAAPISLSSSPAARAFLSRISDAARQALSQRKPWVELVDRTAFSRPDSLSDATSRIRKNWSYFRINYTILLTAIVALSLVSHPMSLFLLCFLLGSWAYMYLIRTGPFSAFGRTFSERELFAIMIILSIVIVFLTNVGSVLISAAMVGFAIICLHASFRVPDDLFLDDDGATTGVYIPFIGSIPVQPPVNVV